ncbi:hypothetical protein ACVWZV_004259 [Bradyrhizobium sp. GM5.1]
MPLMKYFGFVGSALVLLLIAIGWCLPQQAMGPGNSDVERPSIKISSAERAPERVHNRYQLADHCGSVEHQSFYINDVGAICSASAERILRT